jgi:hypothetical protein
MEMTIFNTNNARKTASIEPEHNLAKPLYREARRLQRTKSEKRRSAPRTAGTPADPVVNILRRETAGGLASSPHR